MTSSISPSDSGPDTRKRPHILMMVLLACLCGFGVSFYYTLRINPEVLFWRQVAERKLDWLTATRAQEGRVVAFVGGSTTAFSVDAEHLVNAHGIPAANLGMHAGKGAEVLVGFGLAALEQGDVLVLCLESSLLVEAVGPLPLGIQLTFAIDQPSLLDWRGQQRHPLFPLNHLYSLRPGGYHTFVMLGKLALGLPLYRYSMEDYREGGLLVTDDKRPLPAVAVDAPYALPAPSAEGQALLERVRELAAAKGVEVLYLLPWRYAHTSRVDGMRRAGEEYVQIIELVIPVLREPNMGFYDDPTSFADTVQHLTEEAARMRTDELAEVLRAYLVDELGWKL